MPELPELMVISERLNETLKSKTIHQVTVQNHLVIYGTTVDEFVEVVENKHYLHTRVDGKFLIITLSNKTEIVFNPMLTGHFRLYEKAPKSSNSDVLTLSFDDKILWFGDWKVARRGSTGYSKLSKMSRVYLVKDGNYSEIPDFSDRGPSALDTELTLDVFRTRLKRFNGEIKNILRNQRFVKGIGNAYSDEILLFAGILPFRRRTSLNSDEIESLYDAMRRVLRRYYETLADKTLKEVSSEKRSLLMVHGKGGSVCPLCGGRISEVKAHRFKTNYCQTCQL